MYGNILRYITSKFRFKWVLWCLKCRVTNIKWLLFYYCVLANLPFGSLLWSLSGWGGFSTGIDGLGGMNWEWVIWLLTWCPPCSHFLILLLVMFLPSLFLLPKSSESCQIIRDKLCKLNVRKWCISKWAFCHQWYSRFPLSKPNTSPNWIRFDDFFKVKVWQLLIFIFVHLVKPEGAQRSH